jgi:azurin/DNA-binding transcriptional ArsR family regulator
VLCLSAPAFAQQEPPPKILLDAAPRAVEYQLGRLSNAELVRVERKPDDPRYRLVYYALLTRKGVGREYFDEALAVLTKLDKSSAPRVLLEALAKIPPDDEQAADRVLRVLFAQPADALKNERAAFARAADTASGVTLRGAYGGMMLADGDPQAAWQLAAGRDGHLVELLRSVPSLTAATELRARLFDPVAALLKATAEPQDPALKTAAVTALGSTRADAATFNLLAREVTEGADAEVRMAAVRSLQRLPRQAWPADRIEPVARAILAMVKETGSEARTAPATIEAIHVAETLAEALGDEPRRSLMRDIRALGVQVVRIATIPEQMTFDQRWFVIEAGRPVQIVLTNPDAMSHNLLIGKPGSLKEIGTLSMTMTPSSDPKVKPYVPDTPLVLQATRLLNWGETDRLNFTAPKEPGEYPFVCTFPGHWVRMYGVMLVVDKLEAWEAKRTVPADPMTGKPFPSQKVE